LADYFTPETDEALARFIAAQEIAVKHELFDKHIRPAFEKLIENQIYVYRFFSIDDISTLKQECLSNMYEMIPKYDPSRATKGFSYFNVVCKNWFIQKARERSKKARLESELYLDLDHESAKNDPSFSISPHEDMIEEKERWIKFYETMESWRDQLTKKTEKQVLEAVIFIMKNPDLVSIYNKKAIYLYLRELTGLNTKQVVVNLKKIKGLYNRWSRKYSEDGEADDGDGDDDGEFG
jgi:hypothetical protein